MQISVNNLYMQTVSTLLCILFLSLSSLPAQAAFDGQPFPRAELLNETQFNDTEYRLVLSGLKRKQGVTSGEVERLITGDILRQVWQISVNHEVNQIIEHFLAQWQGAILIYRCSGLDCGSSNFWANNIFENAKLYGRDADQAYIVAKVPGDPTKINVLYAVHRSKNKLYFNLDQITTTDFVSDTKVEQEALKTELKKEAGWLKGFVVKDGLIDEKGSAVLLDTLKNLDSTIKRRLNLIVHCYQSNSMSENLACSTRLAQQLRAAIYHNSEIPVYGQGALSLPEGNNLQPQVRFILWPRH